jgi:hypothetical protein
MSGAYDSIGPVFLLAWIFLGLIVFCRVPGEVIRRLGVGWALLASFVLSHLVIGLILFVFVALPIGLSSETAFFVFLMIGSAWVGGLLGLLAMIFVFALALMMEEMYVWRT